MSWYYSRVWFHYWIPKHLKAYIPKLASKYIINLTILFFKGTWSYEDSDILQFYKVWIRIETEIFNY